MPDMIVPVPETALRRFLCGEAPSELLARSLSKFLARPVIKLLSRSEEFLFRRREPIVAKAILLVDDVRSERLAMCAKLLREGFPHRIDGLVFSIGEE